MVCSQILKLMNWWVPLHFSVDVFFSERLWVKNIFFQKYQNSLFGKIVVERFLFQKYILPKIPKSIFLGKIVIGRGFASKILFAKKYQNSLFGKIVIEKKKKKKKKKKKILYIYI